MRFTHRVQRLAAIAVVLVAAASQASADEPNITFTVAAGDTLIGLSNTVFTSPAAWKEIAALNRLRNPNRISPGQVLIVPQRLLRWQAIPVALLSSSGDVQVNDAPLAAGGAPVTLAEGQTLRTGEAGSAVIEMVDGSRFKLPPSSLAEIVNSRRYAAGGAPGTAPDNSPSTGLFSGVLRVLRGSVEVFASKVQRARPLEVTTPTAVVGVRGTHYRVSYDEAANQATRTEVLEGKVRADTADATVGADVAYAFGAKLDAEAKPPAVVALLSAPKLDGIAPRFERPLVRFNTDAGDGALRVQVAADAAFDSVVSDQRVAGGDEVRLAGLPDGDWHLRARRVDALGIEGFDAMRGFVLKARPEPPASRAPRANAKQPAGTVEFAWSENLEAQSYRLQVAHDAGFQTLLIDRSGIAQPTLTADLPGVGIYFWRLASVRGDSDSGPFGDPLGFELKALPEPPQGGVSEDGKQIRLTWGGRPGDGQRVELARDAAFTDIVARAELSEPQWSVEPPAGPGTYYFRYQSIEPDGYVSPFSSTLKLDVPRDWSRVWLLLAPLLFAL
jgi:hypothetical protein